MVGAAPRSACPLPPVPSFRHALGCAPGKAGRRGGNRDVPLLPTAGVAAVMPWWPVLQARVVQICHRAGVAAASRQPSRPRRHHPRSVTLIVRSCSGPAALHRPLGLPQPAQLRRQRPGAVLQILQVLAAVERPPIGTTGPAAPVAGLGGARTSVVGPGPTATGVALVDPRAGREGDLPGPAGLPAAHQVSPPLAWLPGSDQPTKQAGTARPEPHRGTTVLPRPVRLAGYGLSGRRPKPRGPPPSPPWRSGRPVMSCPAGSRYQAGNRLWIVGWGVTRQGSHLGAARPGGRAQLGLAP
jgi:hypothetical protein